MSNNNNLKKKQQQLAGREKEKTHKLEDFLETSSSSSSPSPASIIMNGIAGRIRCRNKLPYIWW